jgi:hypothetical protein
MSLTSPEVSAFDTRVPAYLRRLERAMDALLPSGNTDPDRLHEAMRYACEGGKHLRALMVYAAGETLGVAPEKLDAAACAVELIHAYSLVHDDSAGHGQRRSASRPSDGAQGIRCSHGEFSLAMHCKRSPSKRWQTRMVWMQNNESA